MARLSMDEKESPNDSKSGKDPRTSRIGPTLFKVFETAATTFSSIAVLGLAWYSYHLYYKALVLRKIDKTFARSDPMLDLAAPPGAHIPPGDTANSTEDDDNWVPRPEQAKIDAIINGGSEGRYYLMVSERGTGAQRSW
ncbi:hypothetical protein LTR06_011186 [Exophiala xenobiotica]|nr:hypothetical protein LTR06_011186 [Exophiala xenobiotica]